MPFPSQSALVLSAERSGADFLGLPRPLQLSEFGVAQDHNVVGGITSVLCTAITSARQDMQILSQIICDLRVQWVSLSYIRQTTRIRRNSSKQPMFP